MISVPSYDRRVLCRAGWMFTRDTIYQTAEGLEIDSTEHHEIVRRRVFFDDVHLVTFHRDRGILYLLFTGLAGGFFCGLGLFMLGLSLQTWPAAVMFFLFGVPPMTFFLIRLAVGRLVITVFGRRTKAVLPFSGARQRRAREVYGQVCAAVRRAQAQ